MIKILSTIEPHLEWIEMLVLNEFVLLLEKKWEKRAPTRTKKYFENTSEGKKLRKKVVVYSDISGELSTYRFYEETIENYEESAKKIAEEVTEKKRTQGWISRILEKYNNFWFSIFDFFSCRRRYVPGERYLENCNDKKDKAFDNLFSLFKQHRDLIEEVVTIRRRRALIRKLMEYYKDKKVSK